MSGTGKGRKEAQRACSEVKVSVPKSGAGGGAGPGPSRWHAPLGRAEDPSPAALLLEGTQAKERGNQLFRKNEHRAAIRLYKQAILSTRGLYSRTKAMSIFSQRPAVVGSKGSKAKGSKERQFLRLSHEDEAQLRQLTQSLHANLSACYLKLDDWEKAVRYAAVVLESDPGNVKSMLRLGQAYHMLGDLLGADRILTKAAALHYANDALGKALKETLRVVRAKMRSKERRLAHYHQQYVVGATAQGADMGSPSAVPTAAYVPVQAPAATHPATGHDVSMEPGPAAGGGGAAGTSAAGEDGGRRDAPTA